MSSPKGRRPVTLIVGGMSCYECLTTVRAALSEASGVKLENVWANLATGMAGVSVDDSIDDATLIKAVERAGYIATTKPSKQISEIS